jgi:hypothetical protein
MPREADVLANHAEEEAAKILILMDIVRCPRRLCAAKIGIMVKWFYDHLARLIYANAASWKPMQVAQLRDYVDNTRKAHYQEGGYGEYILPNWEIFGRESKLYADIEVYENGEPGWNARKSFAGSFPSLMPRALAVAEALSALGIFSPKGFAKRPKYGARWNLRTSKALAIHDASRSNFSRASLRKILRPKELSKAMSQASMTPGRCPCIILISP